MAKIIEREINTYWQVSFEEINQRVSEIIAGKPHITVADVHLEIKEEYGDHSIRLFYNDKETRKEYTQRKDKEAREKKETEERERKRYEELKKKFG